MDQTNTKQDQFSNSPSSLKLHALIEPSCPLERVIGPWFLVNETGLTLEIN